MKDPLPELNGEALPVGRTRDDQERNAKLLAGYDYGRYGEALTGYTGQDLQRIAFCHWQPAVRVRIGDRGNYKAGMAMMPNGDLVLATCRNVEKIFHIFVYSSRDQGATWKRLEHTPLHGKEVALAALPDGTLVMTAQGGVGPGTTPTQVPVYRSDDGGKTWTLSIIEYHDYPRNLFVERDGTLLFARPLMPGWEGITEFYRKDGKTAGAPSPNLQLCRSKDGGRTWGFCEGVVDWDYTNYGEVSAIRLKSGKLIATLRRQLPGSKGEGFEDTVITESTDNGGHWSTPWRLTDTAEVHVYLTELSDGRVVASYSNYHLPWGAFAVISSDEGRSWDREHPIQIALSAGYWVGWPVTLELPDKSLVTSYAATTYLNQPPDMYSCEVVRWNPPKRSSRR